jgi:protein O-mannosyl-transferase
LSILVLVSYWAVAGNQFTSYDDPQYVTENYHVQRGLDRETVVWAFTTSRASNWHPLTWLSLMLDRELYWRNAGGYHWTNVILHLLGGLILFLALSRMTASLWRSGLVAALFLIHPLHVESVAWVAERKDVLSGLFWTLGIWCYARYAERPGIVRYLWVILSFACGVLSKPMVVTFPFVLLLLDRWPLGRAVGGRATWGALLYEKIPLFLLSAAVSLITFLIQKEDQAMPLLSAMPLADRLANATVSYAAYLGKTFWPAGLSIFYPYHGLPPFGHWVSALAMLILITAMSVGQMKRRPYLLVGWLWYLGTLVPVIGLVQVGSQAMADRYTYLPLVGAFIMVVWGLTDLLDGCRLRRPIRGVISGSVIVALVVLTQIQVGHWKDTQTLFDHALRHTDRNFMAHQILAEGMSKAGDLAGAEKHYRETIRIMPSFKQAYTGLGHLLMIRGRQDEASRLLEKALEIDPTYGPAMKNLGDVRMRQGKIGEAIPLYQKAVLLYDEDPELLNNYGVALFLKKEKEEAVVKIRTALRLKPDYPEAQDNLRKILESR